MGDRFSRQYREEAVSVAPFCLAPCCVAICNAPTLRRAAAAARAFLLVGCCGCLHNIPGAAPTIQGSSGVPALLECTVQKTLFAEKTQRETNQCSGRSMYYGFASPTSHSCICCFLCARVA